MKKLIILLALAGLILAGCGDKAAIDRAKARRIEQETRDSAAEKAAEEERKQANWESTKDAADFAKRVFFLLVVCALCLALAVALAILVYRWWQISRSFSDAFSIYAERRAELAAGTIKLDRETRTFPALVAHDAVHQLEHGEVFRLGKPRRADPQQVTASAQVRALGVTAQAAERIAKSTQDAQTADALPGLAGSLPLVLPSGDSSTVIVESDTSETVDL